MNKIFRVLTTHGAAEFLFCLLLITSCKKDKQNDHSPIADAGPDVEVYPPNTSTVLDGSASTDPDNDIVSYDWLQISGPSTASITVAPGGKKTQVLIQNLLGGTYVFELTVTDARSLSSRDKVSVKVNPIPPIISSCDGSSRTVVPAQLILQGNLSKARSGMAALAAGNKIVFAGSGGTLYADGATSNVDIFDTATFAHTTASLSIARSGIGTVAAGNKIFFAGGDSNSPFGACYATVDVYDISVNSWTTLSLSQPRSYVAAAAIGNKVIFAGGYVDSYGDATDRVDIYDISTNTWSVANLSVPRGCAAAVVANNKVYFAGGNDYNKYYNTLDVYDNATGTWSATTLNELTGGWFAGVAAAGKIYWATDCKVQIMDVITGNGSSAGLSQQGWWRSELGQNAVIKNNKIIFFRHYSGTASMFDIYDISTGKWTAGMLPGNFVAAASIISVNNKIYIAGGWIDGDYSKLSDKVYRLEF